MIYFCWEDASIQDFLNALSAQQRKWGIGAENPYVKSYVGQRPALKAIWKATPANTQAAPLTKL
jgi:hypothetical protein